MQDKELAAVFAAIPGIEVTHHHHGRGRGYNYFVHMRVVNNRTLNYLLDFCEAANVAVMIYRHDNEYRYTAHVKTKRSRELVFLVSGVSS